MSPAEAAALFGLGLIVGSYATAIGAGGGFLITPFLLIRYPDALPAEITSASLTVVAISSGISTATMGRAGRVDWRVAGLLALASIPLALLGAVLIGFVPRSLFTVGIAGLLLLLAVYLGWRPRAKFVDPLRRGWQREFTDGRGDTYLYTVPPVRSAIASGIAAFVASIAGIGGGPFYVPIATRILRMPHPLAVPAAHVAIACLATVVVLYHAAAGNFGAPLDDAIWIGAGVIAGNPLGQQLNRRLGEGPLTRLFAAGLLLIALRAAWSIA